MIRKENKSICPICGRDNNCMANSDESCWCLSVEIPQELLDIVPESKMKKACICLKCIQDFKKDSMKFIREIWDVNTIIA